MAVTAVLPIFRVGKGMAKEEAVVVGVDRDGIRRNDAVRSLYYLRMSGYVGQEPKREASSLSEQLER